MKTVLPPRNVLECYTCPISLTDTPELCSWQPISRRNWICELACLCDSRESSAIQKPHVTCVYFQGDMVWLLMHTWRSRITGLTHSVFRPRLITSRSHGWKQSRQYLVWSRLWSFHQLWFTGVLGTAMNIWKYEYPSISNPIQNFIPSRLGPYFPLGIDCIRFLCYI